MERGGRAAGTGSRAAVVVPCSAHRRPDLALALLAAGPLVGAGRPGRSPPAPPTRRRSRRTRRTMSRPFWPTPREAQRLRPDHGGVTLRAGLRLRADRRHGRRVRHAAPLRRPRLHGRPRRGLRLRAACAACPAFDALRRALARNADADLRRTAGLHPRRARPAHRGDRLRPGTRAFFVGSVHQRKILRVDRHGRRHRFVAAARRRALGAARHAGRPGAAGPLGGRGGGAADGRLRRGGRGPVAACSASTSRPARSPARFPLPATAQPHALGDVTITRAATCTRPTAAAPVIYRVRAGADSLEAFVDVAPAPLRPGPRARRRRAHAVRGRLRARHPPGRSRDARGRACCRRRTTCSRSGIDGLYLVSGELVGIQNGVDAAPGGAAHLDAAGEPHRVGRGARARAAGLRRADARRGGGARPVLRRQQSVGAVPRRRHDRRARRAAAAAGAALALCGFDSPRGVGIRLPPRHASRRLLLAGRDLARTSAAAPRTRSSRSSSACCASTSARARRCCACCSGGRPWARPAWAAGSRFRTAARWW